LDRRCSVAVIRDPDIQPRSRENKDLRGSAPQGSISPCIPRDGVQCVRACPTIRLQPCSNGLSFAWSGPRGVACYTEALAVGEAVMPTSSPDP
jgi:hypothetical protein